MRIPVGRKCMDYFAFNLASSQGRTTMTPVHVFKSMGVTDLGAERLARKLRGRNDFQNNELFIDSPACANNALSPKDVLVRANEGEAGHARSEAEAIRMLDRRQPNVILPGKRYLTRENVELIMVEGFERRDIPEILRFIHECTGAAGNKSKTIRDGVALEWRFTSQQGTSPQNIELTYNGQVIYTAKKY